MITVLVSRRPGCPLLEHFKALLDDRQRLHEIALQAHEDVRGVLVRSAHRLFGLVLSLLEQLLRLRLRVAQDRLVLQEQGRLLVRRADDLFGHVSRFAEHAVSLLIDAACLPHLFRDGDPELVDEIQHGRLLEDDLTGHRHLAGVHDQGFKPFHEELDVHDHPPPPGSLYRRNTRSSSPICFVRTASAFAGSLGGCLRRIRAMTLAPGASDDARFGCARVCSRTATSANGGSRNAKSYRTREAPRSRKPMTLVATTSDRPAKPVLATFCRSAASAGAARSTNVACAAPRESASIPIVPAPANRSSTRASPRSGSRIWNNVSRIRSVAGRVPVPVGATRPRPFASPAMTLI